MRLNNFIIDSDFDGQKQVGSLEMEFTVPSFNWPTTDTPYKYKEFDAPEGSFFSTCTLSDSIEPGKTFSCERILITKNNINYNISVNRSGVSKYRIWCAASYSGSGSTTIPSHTIKAKVRFYVASKD